jgi:thiol:disulfide interchange protein DsbC
MNRIFTAASVLIATIALPISALTAEADAELEAVRAKVSSMFDMIDPGDISASPVDGWYTVQKGSVLAYVSGDGRFLLQGDLIDLDRGVNLSELSRNDARRELVATLKDEESILFSPADVKHSVTVFTDIDCTYCRKLHSEIEQYMSKGIAVRYVLYPRNGRRSHAWTTSENVWCSNDRNSALTAAKLDREFQTSSCDASMIARHYQLGQDIGLTGTPAIVTEDGTLIGGYVPADALSVRLDQAESAE